MDMVQGMVVVVVFGMEKLDMEVLSTHVYKGGFSHTVEDIFSTVLCNSNSKKMLLPMKIRNILCRFILHT